MFYIPNSFSLSMSALIGGALGKGQVDRAKSIMRQVFFIMISCVILAVLFVRCYSFELVSIFTSSKELQIIAS